ncbi:hypothetical protein C2R96_06335, partial [Helicobacter pylori]
MSEEISQLPHNQVNTKDIVTLPYDKKAPAARQYNYQIKPEKQSKTNKTLEKNRKNHFKKQKRINTKRKRDTMNVYQT